MKKLLFFMSVMFIITSLCADSFDEKLQQLAEDSAKEYVRPLVTSFGVNLNSGLYNTAAVLKPSIMRPIRFGFTFNTMLAMIPNSDKKFNTTFDPEMPGVDPYEIESATVFGDKGYQDGYISFPDGLDLSVVPLIVPQFRLGLPRGNELMVRYMPPMELGDMGNLNFWGIGLKHSIDQYIPLFPLDLAVQGAYNSFEVGNLVSIKSTALNAQVSKRILMLTLYGGLGWEDTTLKAKYEYENPDDANDTKNISFKIKGDNQFRMTTGFRWAVIPFIHLNADYTISSYQAITLGFGMQL